MRNATLLLGLLVVTPAIAAMEPADIVRKMPAAPQLQKIDGVYYYGNQKESNLTVSELAEKGLQFDKKNTTVKKNRAPYAKEIWENPAYDWKIDSVIGKGPDGNLTLRQTFEFDNRGNALLQKNFNWDAEANDWVLQNSHTMTWNESNACLTDKIEYFAIWGNSGQNTVYIYGSDQLYPEGCEIYMLDGETGEWKLSQKSFWKYDANYFMTEEIIQAPDENGNLVNYSKATAKYDAAGQPTYQDFYLWSNGKWEPNGSRITTEYDSQERMISWLEESWNGKEWEGVKRIKQEWAAAPKSLTYQSLEYYDVERNDWHGSMYMPSAYSTIAYNDQDRPIHEKGYTWDFDKNDWANGVDIINEYEPLNNGGYRQTQKMVWVQQDYISDVYVCEYNKAGNVTYRHEDVWDGSKLTPYEEAEYTYDETGTLVLEGTAYQYSNGTRLAFVKQLNSWGKNGLPIQSYYWHGRLMDYGEGEPDEWVPFTHFIYDTENGVEEGRWCYRWNNQKEEFMPFWADTRTFDFSVPIDKCCLWPQTDIENAKYMITSKRVYSGVDSDWAYEEGIYYNSKVGGSGIEAARIDSNIRLYPNPVVDKVTVSGVDADRYDIYSVSGALMISSESPEIDASSLTPGLYLLNAGGKSFKFIKK